MDLFGPVVSSWLLLICVSIGAARLAYRIACDMGEEYYHRFIKG